MGGLNDFLFGTSDKTTKLQNFDQNQQQFFGNFMKQLQQMQKGGGGVQEAMGLLQQYLNPQSDIYKNFEQPYMQQFEQQTVPGLAEKFAGFGGGMGGGMSSSGFGQALGAAGSNLQTNLAQMKSGMQQNAIGSLLGQYNQMSGMGLGAQPFSYQQQQGSQGFAAPFLGNLAGSFMKGGF